MEDTDRKLSLVSKTGDKFEISYSAAKLSQLVSDATEKFESDDDNSSVITPPVEILKVESDCLAKVVEFMEHYEKEPLEEIQTPLADNTFEGVVKQAWYREFVAVDNPMLFDLVTAANFMAIREYY
jgi:S-phase kinase-associated protein 1